MADSLKTITALILSGMILVGIAGCKKSAPQPQKQGSDQAKATTTDTDKPAKEDSAAQDSGLEPINIVLPESKFVGTPQPTNIENLEKPADKAREPFLAPKGTTNVALNKPVTSSEEFPIIGELEQITDGVKDASEGNFVELGPELQNITIDLEGQYNIYAIVIWHYHQQARVYKDVVVRTANDGDFIDNVNIVFNNDIDASAGMGVGKDKHYVETAEGKLIDCKGIKGRYVQLYSNGNTTNELNHYIEVEVYGTPAE